VTCVSVSQVPKGGVVAARDLLLLGVSGHEEYALPWKREHACE
jgi:hypothetical protein